jgi:hypothetical protein
VATKNTVDLDRRNRLAQQNSRQCEIRHHLEGGDYKYQIVWLLDGVELNQQVSVGGEPWVVKEIW